MCVCVHDRAIPLHRPQEQLRSDLDMWLKRVCGEPSEPLLSGSRENVHNKRFAMLAINVVKDLKTNPFASTYRVALGQSP